MNNNFQLIVKFGKIIIDFLSILLYNQKYAGVRRDFEVLTGKIIERKR